MQFFAIFHFQNKTFHILIIYCVFCKYWQQLNICEKTRVCCICWIWQSIPDYWILLRDYTNIKCTNRRVIILPAKSSFSQEQESYSFCSYCVIQSFSSTEFWWKLSPSIISVFNWKHCAKPTSQAVETSRYFSENDKTLTPKFRLFCSLIMQTLAFNCKYNCGVEWWRA